MQGDWARRLADPAPLLLDGATGTELERRGVRSALPLWSVHALIEAPDQVAAVHQAYVAAGAELLTANTFRTQRRTLARAGLGDRAGPLTALAVELARRAGGRFVLGSAPPLEDCFRPDLVPDAETLEQEHAEHAGHLAAAGVDAVLAETMNTSGEAVAAACAAREAGLPVIVSFVCGDGAALLSGEPLADAISAVAHADPLAVGVNCLPPSRVPACLEVLRSCGLPFAIYANLGAPVGGGTGRTEWKDPQAFAALAEAWISAGARIVGGCCGTTPAHIRALAERLQT
jgi:S-methylmethionine-dependent homocysteine/selenocysteine methylase